MAQPEIDPQQLRQNAIDALEHEQDPDKAIQLDEDAAQMLIARAENADTEDERNEKYGKAADTISHEVICYNRLYRNTNDDQYLILALQAAQRAVDIASNSSYPGDQVMPLYNLAKALDRQKQYKEAVNALDRAIAIHEGPQPAKEHNRDSVRLDMRVHREYLAYKGGDKTVIDRLDAALGKLARIAAENKDKPEGADGKEDQYTLEVWVTGGDLKAAEILFLDDRARGLTHLQSAREMIRANPQLILRRDDYNALAAQYGEPLLPKE